MCLCVCVCARMSVITTRLPFTPSRPRVLSRKEPQEKKLIIFFPQPKTWQKNYWALKSVSTSLANARHAVVCFHVLISRCQSSPPTAPRSSPPASPPQEIMTPELSPGSWMRGNDSMAGEGREARLFSSRLCIPSLFPPCLPAFLYVACWCASSVFLTQELARITRATLRM